MMATVITLAKTNLKPSWRRRWLSSAGQEERSASHVRPDGGSSTGVGAQGSVGQSPGEPHVRGEALPASPQSMPRILVIDDDQSVRRVCGLALRSQGWHAEGEGSARQALARLRSGERFDAVVLDFAMPDLDGIAFLRELAANSIARPPILMASAHADGLTAQRALALGVWDFLSKPLTPNDLRRGVGRLLDRPIAARNGQPRARALLQAVRGDWGAALAALQASSYPEDDLLRGLLLQLQGDVSAANSCFARVGWGLGWKEQGSEIWAELARRLDR